MPRLGSRCCNLDEGRPLTCGFVDSPRCVCTRPSDRRVGTRLRRCLLSPPRDGHEAWASTTTWSRLHDGQVHASMATGHTPWFLTKRPLPRNGTVRGTAPQGGIVASACDLARYLIVMMDGRDDVLSAEAKASMMRHDGGTSPFYGLGWFAAALGLDDDGEGSRWPQKALFVALVLLPVAYLASIVWAWRHRQQTRVKSGLFGLFSWWFPLVTTLAAAWVTLRLVPCPERPRHRRAHRQRRRGPRQRSCRRHRTRRRPRHDRPPLPDAAGRLPGSDDPRSRASAANSPESSQQSAPTSPASGPATRSTASVMPRSRRAPSPAAGHSPSSTTPATAPSARSGSAVPRGHTRLRRRRGRRQGRPGHTSR